ncbi:glutathione S-transferase [Shewanella sedimentimangrovi]|uniref:Glutathione S-transferase n=2 Tax=Shewanella sedimentimangrovi TaxID=2814293 RepID=A0ABX7R6E3_9GAMM|nr:glutathione S-transferase [Shewanella sedimentimangrovi]
MPQALLYSFRRCPYAMRARAAIASAGIEVRLREVMLKRKPPQLLAINPKGTVPVLQLEDKVLTESLDIMVWALGQRDPHHLFVKDREPQLQLIRQMDKEFKPWLDKYKYADRHPQHGADHYRSQCLEFLAPLEPRLAKQAFLYGPTPSMADLAVFPFVRQFAMVDNNWFEAALPGLAAWLTIWLQGPLFSAIMTQYVEFADGGAEHSFGDCQLSRLV